MRFQLDPRLAASAVLVGRTGLNQLRLQSDARFPWIVLIPERPGLRELQDLKHDAYQVLMSEALLAGAAVRSIGAALARPVDKLNIGALGNVVSQLHLHVVGRRADDPAWPGPVWGFGEAVDYTDEARAAALSAARDALGSALKP